MIRNKDKVNCANYSPNCSLVLQTSNLNKTSNEIFNLKLEESKINMKNNSDCNIKRLNALNSINFDSNISLLSRTLSSQQVNLIKKSENKSLFIKSDLNLKKESLNKKSTAENMVKHLNTTLVFCGPSGSGKSSLLKKLINEYKDDFGFSISHTTRKPRTGEIHGKDYYFVSREEMLKAIENDEFIEYAEFSGNIYGTSKKAIQDVQTNNKICILDIEIKGVKSIKKSNLHSIYVFIKPPSILELKNRLRKRGTENDETIERRLNRVIEEIEYGEKEGNFDLLLINDDFDTAYDLLRQFVCSKYDLNLNKENI